MAEYKAPKLKLKKVSTKGYTTAKPPKKKDAKVVEAKKMKLKRAPIKAGDLPKMSKKRATKKKSGIPMIKGKSEVDPNRIDFMGMTREVMKEGMAKQRLKNEKKINKLIKKMD